MYVECETWQPSGTGRAARQYKVSYVECDSGKPSEVKFGGSGKVTVITPDKIHCKVSYTDTQRKLVILADEDFNEVELPISRFDTKDPAEGTKVIIYKDDEAVMKVTV